MDLRRQTCLDATEVGQLAPLDVMEVELLVSVGQLACKGKNVRAQVTQRLVVDWILIGFFGLIRLVGPVSVISTSDRPGGDSRPFRIVVAADGEVRADDVVANLRCPPTLVSAFPRCRFASVRSGATKIRDIMGRHPPRPVRFFATPGWSNMGIRVPAETRLPGRLVHPHPCTGCELRGRSTSCCLPR